MSNKSSHSIDCCLSLTQSSQYESGESVRFIEKSNLRQQNDDQKKIATDETASVFESFEQNEQKAILLYCLISCIFDSEVTCFINKKPKKLNICLWAWLAVHIMVPNHQLISVILIVSVVFPNFCHVIFNGLSLGRTGFAEWQSSYIVGKPQNLEKISQNICTYTCFYHCAVSLSKTLDNMWREDKLPQIPAV